MCPGGCSGNGRCFLGKCFCVSGYEGDYCSIRNNEPLPPPQDPATGECLVDNDMCHFSEKYGVTVVPYTRWLRAQTGEAAHWKSAPDTEDGWEHHGKDFNHYQSLAHHDLGKFVEIGCGPFTQTYYVMKMIPDATITRVTLVDPLIYKYLREVKSCNYQDGRLNGYPVTLISSQSEALDFCEAYDTLLSVNVLEHVQNAFEHLELLYHAIRPNGTIIFHDRWWNDYIPTKEIAENRPQWLLHPIRARRPVFDHFMSLFDLIHAKIGQPPKVPGIYMIGRKKILDA